MRLSWEYDHRAAEEFGRIQAEQKAKGLPIPSADAKDCCCGSGKWSYRSIP